MRNQTRHLLLILGDSLDRASAAFDGFDPGKDAVAMVEVRDEIMRYGNHRARVAQFLLAMRAFARELSESGVRVVYQRFDAPDALSSFAMAFGRMLDDERPEKVIWVEAGRHGLDDELIALCETRAKAHEVRDDRHFMCSREQFARWAKGRTFFLMEHFYRVMRRQHRILMDGDKPAGDRWNYDADNRAAFGKSGPGLIAPASRPERSDEELSLLAQLETLPGLNGTTAHFDWAVTPAEAEAWLGEFLANHLQDFGSYQDAMWTGAPFLHHSRLSAAMNLKLLNPRTVVMRAEQAWRDGRAPLHAVEGFIRQIIGWREYIRGIYWEKMPRYEHLNYLGAEMPLPPMYWNGKTEMRCMQDVVGQLLDHAYAHHIQRLMVAGLFAQLLAVRPTEIHEWFMAYFVDSVEWVTMPNVLGMSQYADGGIVGSKPYIATGKYIDRQSNYCRECKYKPDMSSGEKACPVTTLYWDFLDRHQEEFADHPRLGLQVKNVRKKPLSEMDAIRRLASEVRARAAAGAL
jgi:deoxyribodipyrimidine photolyase-related protein